MAMFQRRYNVLTLQWRRFNIVKCVPAGIRTRRLLQPFECSRLTKELTCVTLQKTVYSFWRLNSYYKKGTESDRQASESENPVSTFKRYSERIGSKNLHTFCVFEYFGEV